MHESFLDAIRDRPEDDAPLLIYADWLEERGDPRAEYIRLGSELAGLPPGDGRVLDLRARFRRARSAADPAWVAAMEQPGILRANPTPYPAGWWGVGMTRDQLCSYQFWDHASLPSIPVAAIHESLDWLSENSELRLPIRWSGIRGFRGESNFDALGLALPARHLSIIGRWHTDRRICSGVLVRESFAVPAPGDPASFLLRFCFDRLWSRHWYLHLGPEGGHCVVVSPVHIQEGRGEQSGGERRSEGEIPLWYCAPSLETFLYRWLLEAQIWYAIQNSRRGERLTEAGRAYLEQYGPVPPGW